MNSEENIFVPFQALPPSFSIADNYVIAVTNKTCPSLPTTSLANMICAVMAKYGKK